MWLPSNGIYYFCGKVLLGTTQVGTSMPGSTHSHRIQEEGTTTGPSRRMADVVQSARQRQRLTWPSGMEAGLCVGSDYQGRDTETILKKASDGYAVTRGYVVG